MSDEVDRKIEELRALVNDDAPAPTPPAPAPDPPTPLSGGGIMVVSPSDAPAPTMRSRPELPAYVLAALAIIGIVVLTLKGDPVPDILNVATIASLGVGGAITVPGRST